MSYVPLPIITYVNSEGSQVLQFQVPATGKPAFSQQATRTDTFSTGGVRQTVLQRVDETFPITVPAIHRGDDAAAWVDFLRVAVQGTTFSYYPDRESGTYQPCFLVESDIKMPYANAPSFTFTGTFQVEVDPPDISDIDTLLSVYGGFDAFNNGNTGILSHIVNEQFTHL